MATTTTRLGLPRPVATDNVTLANHQALIDAIDTGAAKATDIPLKADLASPALTGTPTAPTAVADTTTTQLATTAFVIGQASAATPLMDGVATVGTSKRYAREGHIHPTDTSRAPLASPALTGTPTAPTAVAGTNTTQLATTAFVEAARVILAAADGLKAPLASPALTGTPTAPTAAPGTNTTQLATTAFVDAVRALLAPLASPALTGTPTAPTATAGTNTTQIATTAFVEAVRATLAAADALKAPLTTLNAHLADYTLQIPYAATTGSANAYVATLSPTLASYSAGVALSVMINVTNTGASTINVNGLGAKNILDSKGNAMTSGKLLINSIYTLRYNGTAFILQGDGGSGNAVAANLLAGKTASVDGGDIVGTMVSRPGTNPTALSIGSDGAGNLDFQVPAGYYDGATALRSFDADFIAANIKSGVNVFNVVGTLIPSGTPLASGTATSAVGVIATFIGENGSNNNAGFPLTISGLSLPTTPKFIEIRYYSPTAGQFGELIIFDVNGLTSTSSSGSGNIVDMSIGNTVGNYGIGVYRLDGTYAYVNSSGFRLPTGQSAKSYEWKIWG